MDVQREEAKHKGEGRKCFFRGRGCRGLLVPPAQGSGLSSCPAHSEQWDCQQEGCLTGEDSGVSSTDQEARSHRAASRGPSSVKTVQ